MTLLTAFVLVGGFLASIRIREQRGRVIGMIVTMALTLVTAWLAWQSTTVV